MIVNLVKLNGKFYLTDNPNKLGSEVILECSKSNQNDWCLDIVKSDNTDMVLLIKSIDEIKRAPGTKILVDSIIEMKVIK